MRRLTRLQHLLQRHERRRHLEWRDNRDNNFDEIMSHPFLCDLCLISSVVSTIWVCFRKMPSYDLFSALVWKPSLEFYKVEIYLIFSSSPE